MNKKLTISFLMTVFQAVTYSMAPNLVFDRDRIINVEGYWASSADPAADTYRGVKSVIAK